MFKRLRDRRDFHFTEYSRWSENYFGLFIVYLMNNILHHNFKVKENIGAHKVHTEELIKYHLQYCFKL